MIGRPITTNILFNQQNKNAKMFAYWFQTAETLRDIISKAFWFCSVYIRSYSYFSSVSKVKFLIRDILESLGASGCRVIRPSVTKHRTFRNLDAFAKKLPSVWKLFQISERRKVSHFRSEKTSNVVFFKYHKKFKCKKQLIVGMRNHLQWRFPPFLEKVRSKVKAIKKCKTRSCWKCFWSFAGGVSPEKVTLTFHLVTLSYYGHPNLWILLCKRHREV